jgi:hypothetical protein
MNRLWRGSYVLDTGVHNSPYTTLGPDGRLEEGRAGRSLSMRNAEPGDVELIVQPQHAVDVESAIRAGYLR